MPNLKAKEYKYISDLKSDVGFVPLPVECVAPLPLAIDTGFEEELLPVCEIAPREPNGSNDDGALEDEFERVVVAQVPAQAAVRGVRSRVPARRTERLRALLEDYTASGLPTSYRGVAITTETFADETNAYIRLRAKCPVDSHDQCTCSRTLSMGGSREAWAYLAMWIDAGLTAGGEYTATKAAHKKCKPTVREISDWLAIYDML